MLYINSKALGMDAETFDILILSVKKWGRNPQQHEDMFILCCENYFLRCKDKEIQDETRNHYLSVLFRNSCIDFLRKEIRLRTHEILMTDMHEEWDEWEELTQKFVNPYPDTDIYLIVENLIKDFNDVDKKIFMELLGKTPYEDLAENLKISLNTIRTKIHRRRKIWKENPQLESIGQ